jgi:recombinational DNA repair protein (RecF pathway)
MAKGVRKLNSKIAGSIELFSTIDITYLLGKGSIDRLLSARLKEYFSNIVKDLERTNAGYDFIKCIDKITEDEIESEWYDLLLKSFTYLNDTSMSLELIIIWFYITVLNMTGHLPNLSNDVKGDSFKEKTKYNFIIEKMSFDANENGNYDSDQIKILKLATNFEPNKLVNIKGIKELSKDILPLVELISSFSLEL